MKNLDSLFPVTNEYEQIVFAFLGIIAITLLFQLMQNFVVIIKLQQQTKLWNLQMYKINMNLVIFTICKINYAILSKNFQHSLAIILLFNGQLWIRLIVLLSKYEYLQFPFQPFYNLIQLAFTFNIKNMDVKFRNKINHLWNFIQLINFSSAILCVINLIFTDIDILINCLSILLMVVSVSSCIIFSISSLTFYFKIADIIQVNKQLKNMFKYGSLVMILSCVNRLIFFTLRQFDPEYWITLKQYSSIDKVDSGYYWALLCLEFFFICDLLPIIILLLIFTPQLNRKIQSSLLKTQVGSNTLSNMFDSNDQIGEKLDVK